MSLSFIADLKIVLCDVKIVINIYKRDITIFKNIQNFNLI